MFISLLYSSANWLSSFMFKKICIKWVSFLHVVALVFYGFKIYFSKKYVLKHTVLWFYRIAVNRIWMIMVVGVYKLCQASDWSARWWNFCCSVQNFFKSWLVLLIFYVVLLIFNKNFKVCMLNLPMLWIVETVGTSRYASHTAATAAAVPEVVTLNCNAQHSDKVGACPKSVDV